MAGSSERQTGVPDRRSSGRSIRRGGSSRRGGAGTTGGRVTGRQNAGTGSGDRHYSAYATSSGHPRPPININQLPQASSAHQPEDDDPPVDLVDEEVEEQELEQDDADEEDYTSIITRAEQYQRQPGREGLTWLDPLRPPNTLWFMDNEVAQNVTKCIQMYFKSPITSWSRGDMRHYSQWFLAFAQKYNWQPSITFTVWELFKAKAILRLKDNTCNLKKNYGVVGDAARPSWLVPSVWAGIKEYWGRTTSMERSVQNSHSRAQNRSKHTSGQISFAKRQIMEADEDGTIPPLYKIYMKVHQRKDGSYITPEAEQLVNQTQQLIDERSVQMSPGGSSVASTNVPPIADQDAIFTQVAPKNRKGKVVGLGSIQNPAFNCRSATSQFRGYVSQEAWEQSQATIQALQEQVTSSQASVQALQDQQANYARQFQDQQANYARQMEEMRQMIQNQVQLQQQSHGYRPMPPPTYDHGHGNAGPSAPPHDQNVDPLQNIEINLDGDFDFPEMPPGGP